MIVSSTVAQNIQTLALVKAGVLWFSYMLGRVKGEVRGTQLDGICNFTGTIVITNDIVTCQVVTLLQLHLVWYDE